MSTLTVLAAGSLRLALTPLLARYTALTGQPVRVDFGPAGLLRRRIEDGELCDLFASANTGHPRQLLAAGLAREVRPFIANTLCLTVRVEPRTQGKDWLALLSDPDLVVGMSTPGCDPSGDYTWELFDRIAPLLPPEAGSLKQRARQLVGGVDTAPLPAGVLAARWLIEQGRADLFIGYAHYARLLAGCPALRVAAIPDEYNIRARYALAVCSATAKPLADFILSPPGQAFLLDAGFIPADGEPG